MPQTALCRHVMSGQCRERWHLLVRRGSWGPAAAQWAPGAPRARARAPAWQVLARARPRPAAEMRPPRSPPSAAISNARRAPTARHGCGRSSRAGARQLGLGRSPVRVGLEAGPGPAKVQVGPAGAVLTRDGGPASRRRPRSMVPSSNVGSLDAAPPGVWGASWGRRRSKLEVDAGFGISAPVQVPHRSCHRPPRTLRARFSPGGKGSVARRARSGPTVFLESIFIDQAALNGRRPVTPVGAEPAVTPSGC